MRRPEAVDEAFECPITVRLIGGIIWQKWWSGKGFGDAVGGVVAGVDEAFLGASTRLRGTGRNIAFAYGLRETG